MPAKKKTTKKAVSKKQVEEYKVEGKKLVGKVKKLINEGNVRRITIKDKNNKTIVVVPVTVGVVGAIVAAPLVVVGAIAAMVTECTISVERTK
ncbi:MAG: DUF4342 domain-containing protein [bacterium]